MVETNGVCYPNQLEYFDDWWIPQLDNDEEIINVTSPKVGILPPLELNKFDSDYLYAEDIIEMQIQERKKKRLEYEKNEKIMQKNKEKNEKYERKLKKRTESAIDKGDADVIGKILNIVEFEKKKKGRAKGSKNKKKM